MVYGDKEGQQDEQMYAGTPLADAAELHQLDVDEVEHDDQAETGPDEMGYAQTVRV